MAKYRNKIQIHNGKQKYTNVQVDSFVVGDSFKAGYPSLLSVSTTIDAKIGF